MHLTRRGFLQTIAAALPAFAQNRPELAAIRKRRDWQAARDGVLAGMQAVMGALPATKRSPVEIVKLESEETASFTRTKIQYLSEPNDPVPAYLLVPKNLRRRAAAMLCLHQTIKIGKGEPVGLGGSANLHYAKELAERGYVCIAPDYPYLGEN
ncbi:MAG: hypothetical protein ACREEM_25550, partial [Blastocatellia bacterium]